MNTRSMHVVVFLMCLYGSANSYAQKFRETTSSLRSNLSVQVLGRIANDTGSESAVRARAVFMLFANYVRPGANAAAIAEVFPDPRWWDECVCQQGEGGAGRLPVRLLAGHTVFFLLLFPTTPPWGWCVCFTLSGQRSAEDAMAFLRGARHLQGDPVIGEFALCFPNGRTERFHGDQVSVTRARPSGARVGGARVTHSTNEVGGD
jgi:hypothetical protein